MENQILTTEQDNYLLDNLLDNVRSISVKELNKKTEYNTVLEVDYTLEELDKIEKLRNHFGKNPEKDVRNYLDAVKVLFPYPDYIVGCGGTHIWVHRSSDKYQRIIYIGSANNCQLWQPKQAPKIIFP